MNPFKPHALNMFSARDSVYEAVEYAHSLINTMSDGPDKVAALTGLMVLVNTAAKLWPEEPAPAPVADAPAPALTLADVDARIAAALNTWVSDEFDARADEWLTDHADLDPEIERWVENNLDVEDEVQDVLRNASLRINF